MWAVFAPLWVPPWRTFIRAYRRIASAYPPGANLNNYPAAKQAVSTASGDLLYKLIFIGLVFYLVAFSYDAIQHAAWGQTIGKRALGTKVVNADTRANVGGLAACGRAAIFALSPLVPLVGWIFALLNELWLTWDRRTQCLHDKAAHTVVVKKSYPGTPPAGRW